MKINNNFWLYLMGLCQIVAGPGIAYWVLTTYQGFEHKASGLMFSIGCTAMGCCLVWAVYKDKP